MLVPRIVREHKGVMAAQHLLVLILLLAAVAAVEPIALPAMVGAVAVQAVQVPTQVAPQVVVVVWVVLVVIYTPATALLEKGQLVPLGMVFRLTVFSLVVVMVLPDFTVLLEAAVEAAQLAVLHQGVPLVVVMEVLAVILELLARQTLAGVAEAVAETVVAAVLMAELAAQVSVAYGGLNKENNNELCTYQ